MRPLGEEPDVSMAGLWLAMIRAGIHKTSLLRSVHQQGMERANGILQDHRLPPIIGRDNPRSKQARIAQAIDMFRRRRGRVVELRLRILYKVSNCEAIGNTPITGDTTFSGPEVGGLWDLDN